MHGTASQECHRLCCSHGEVGPLFCGGVCSYGLVLSSSLPLSLSISLRIPFFSWFSFVSFILSLPRSRSLSFLSRSSFFSFFAYSVASTISRVRITEFDLLLTRRDLSKKNEGKQLFSIENIYVGTKTRPNKIIIKVNLYAKILHNFKHE